MTGIGRSPKGWISALVAIAAVGSGGAGSAIASPTQATVEFAPILPTERHAAVTDLGSPLASPDSLPLPVAYTVCSESTTWTRPGVAEQSSHLDANPRFNTASLSGAAQTWLQSFWEKDVIAFTTYGLSARQEPIYFSGLWSLLEQQPVLDQCYDAERISQMNSGQIAELWLIGHQIQSMQWVGDRYVITVEPTNTGVQFVLFPRREAFTVLPLQIVTEDNVPLEFVSADYSTPL